MAKITDPVPKGFKRIKHNKREDWRRARCIYCGGPNESPDHIPPRSLFPDGTRIRQMRTVPCCRPCNDGYAKRDDDWFRNIIVDWCAKESPIAESLLKTKVAESGRRQPSLLKQISNRAELIDDFSSSGIYIGKRQERFPFTHEEEGCIMRMAERLGKAYYWTLSKKQPPRHYRSTLIEAKRVPQEFYDALKASEWITSGNEHVFMCKALPIGEDFSFILYMFTFYRKFPLLAAYHRPNALQFGPSASGLLLAPR